LAVNPAASVEIQTSDSSTGLKAVENDICDIGMSSRELKSSELYSGMLKPKTIAIDGLAVIVNNENSVYNLTKEQVKSIFTGEILNWKEVK
jgi:phosphate transport system substrate-binding protein